MASLDSIDLRFPDQPAFYLRFTCADLRFPRMPKKGTKTGFPWKSGLIKGDKKIERLVEKIQHLAGLVANYRRIGDAPNKVGGEKPFN